jgi:hypothetical protein
MTIYTIGSATDTIEDWITDTAALTLWFSSYDYQEFTQDERNAANERALRELRAQTQHRDITRLNIPNVARRNRENTFWWRGWRK